jgi:hypothetical protein
VGIGSYKPVGYVVTIHPWGDPANGRVIANKHAFMALVIENRISRSDMFETRLEAATEASRWEKLYEARVETVVETFLGWRLAGP